MLTSYKLAQLAGTTVRTLRHYHAVGVLPEPSRGSNGYRQYGVHDLVSVLRIRRMASLGLSLDQIRVILTSRSSGEAADIGADLDALDASLAEQIARLDAQRELIATIRKSEADLDLPAELSSMFQMQAKNQVDAQSLEVQKQLAVLVAHLRPTDGVSGMRDLLAAMSTGNKMSIAVELSDRIRDIDEWTAADVGARLIEDLVLFLTPITTSISRRAGGGGEDQVLQSVVESIAFGPPGMNSAQSELINAVTKRLSDSMSPSPRIM